MGLGSFFKKKDKKEESHIEINTDDCGGCGKCTISCPNHVLILKDNKSTVNNSLACKRCRVCVAICPSGCIKVN